MFTKATRLVVIDSLKIEQVVFLKNDSGERYIIVDINDNIIETAFYDYVLSDNLRMMAHLYPKKEDLSNIICDASFKNHDFAPTLINLNGYKFISSKLKNLTSSKINFYKWSNLSPIPTAKDVEKF